ncbi:MAG: alpha/beta hydrolase [Myxococcota bacterium]
MHDQTDVTPGSPRIRFWRAGNQGPRVLLVMGFGMRGDLWRPQIEGLKDQHQVAWLDNRGIGESETGSRRSWTMRDMAEDVFRVMDALDWPSAHLVGVSMGGMIVQETTLLDQRRVQTLSLIATHEGGVGGWFPTPEGFRRFLQVNLLPDERRFEALQRLLYPASYLETCDRAQLQERMQAQVGRRAERSTLLAQLGAVLRHRTGPRLGQVRVPTLVVKPEQDILIHPRHSDRLRRRIPHARMLELPGAGHGAVFQCRDEINDELRRHFQEGESIAPPTHARLG